MYGLTFLIAVAVLPGQMPGEVGPVSPISHVLAMRIPFEVPLGEADKVRVVRLYVSEDEGKTWKKVQDRRPTDGDFRFTTPNDGWYWFAVQTEYLDGRVRPATEKLDSSKLRKIWVNTSPRKGR